MVTVLPLHTYTSCQLFPQVCCSKLAWPFFCRPGHGQISRAGAHSEQLANRLILTSGNSNHCNCVAIAHLRVMPIVSASVLLNACVAVLLQTRTWSNFAGWGSQRTTCQSPYSDQ